MQKRFTIIFGIVVGVILLALVAVTFGLYPVALVDGSPIFSFQYNRAYALARAYWQPLNNAAKEPLSSAELVRLLKAAVIEGLIDERVLTHFLGVEIGPSILQEKIDERVTQMKSDDQIQKDFSAIGTFPKNGLTAYFRLLALYDIGQGQLDLENGGDLSAWLADKRKGVLVKEFLPGVEWTEGRVVVQ